MNRRGLLVGLLAVPAVIRTSGLLMPIRVEQPDPLMKLFIYDLAGNVVHRAKANALDTDGVLRIKLPYNALPPNKTLHAGYEVRLPGFNQPLIGTVPDRFHGGGAVRHTFEWRISPA